MEISNYWDYGYYIEVIVVKYMADLKLHLQLALHTLTQMKAAVAHTDCRTSHSLGANQCLNLHNIVFS